MNIRGSCRVSWVHTFAPFTPQTGRVIFTQVLEVEKHTVCYISVLPSIPSMLCCKHVVFVPLSCRISSVDISHIQGNLEEISTFQQMLVQSLEEHTKSVFIFYLLIIQ